MMENNVKYISISINGFPSNIVEIVFLSDVLRNQSANDGLGLRADMLVPQESGINMSI